MIECKQCSWELEEDEAFCPECGTSQKGQGAASGDPNYAAEMPDLDVTYSAMETVDIAPIQVESMQALNRADSGTFPPETVVASECEDFTIFYNSARVLMEDASLPFEFRIQPKRAGLDHLRITISNQQGMKFEGTCRRSLKAGKERNVSVDVRVPAGQRGLLTFDISVEYRNQGAACHYESLWRSEVYPREAQSIQNLVIDITQTQGHAGDIGGVNMSGIEKLAESGNWRAVLSELSKIPPRWKNLVLEECSGFTGFGGSFDFRSLLSDCPPEARLQKLTLEVGGQKIHLISGDRIQMGRARESDIVSRIFDDAGKVLWEENLYISKFHCGFVKSGNSIRVQDGSLVTGEVKNKTWLNGVRLKQSLEIPAGTDFQLSFGQPGAMTRILSFKGRLIFSRSDNGISEPSGILLQRNDRVAECYLIVYDRIPLKCLGAEWGSWNVAHYKEGFCLGNEQSGRWLLPASREFADSHLVDVKPFSQYGLC